MSPVGSDAGPRLGANEYVVAKLMELTEAKTEKHGVHRMTLQALLDAAVQEPNEQSTTVWQVRDRVRLADVLLSLRSHGFAELGDEGFRITAKGRQAVNATPDDAAHTRIDELEELVREKLDEWRLSA